MNKLVDRLYNDILKNQALMNNPSVPIKTGYLGEFAGYEQHKGQLFKNKKDE